MKRAQTTFKALSIAFVATLGLVISALPAGTNAVTAADWKAGRIIDDGIFTNSTSMTPQQIQDFLNARVPVCDTNGTKLTTRWNSAAGRYYTRAEWGAYLVSTGQRGNTAPFTCLKDFWEVPKTDPGPGQPANNYGGAPIPAGAKSAAQIIYDAAQRYQISPKVLLVTIQKESYGPLTSDDWPFKYQYQYSMGAHCPDTAPCDPNYEGFSIQIYESARLFRYYLNNMNQSWWPYKKPFQNNYVLWNVASTSCGGSNVFIETMATAALYTYTPYQPNAAALANMSGTGDGCSAYGNRNFWRIFNDWFGNTIGPDYSWAIESLVYSGGDNYISPGQTETVTLRARNNGRVPWYNHGDHPVRLRTWEPADHYSAIYGTSMLANMTESAVPVGSVGTFTYTITAGNSGIYADSLNLVAENYSWFAWPGFRPTVVVPKAYDWQVQNVIYEKGTGFMSPGDTQLITLIAKNTGSATWSKTTGPSIRLGTWQPERESAVGNQWMSNKRVTMMNETTVAPGQNAGFQFYVRMPNIGTFYERLNLVAEGQAWFNDPGLTLYLEGGAYSWSIDSIQYSSGTGVMEPGSAQTVTVKARNTGTATWRNTGDFPVRLGTWQPQRQSAVSASWISNTRMTTLQENSVIPGQTGTFTATVTMPAVGTYYERMNLVAEGIRWFNDPGMTFYLEGRN